MYINKGWVIEDTEYQTDLLHVYKGHNMRKHTFLHESPTNTQISVCIRTVWSQSSFPAWRNFSSLAIQIAPNEDSDQTARMRSLIWIFTGHMSEETFSDTVIHVKHIKLFTCKDHIFQENYNICHDKRKGGL